MTGPWPVPKRVHRTVRSSASSFNFWYILVSLGSSISCIRILPRLLVPSGCPSITCFRRQFLRKMWPIHLALFRFIVCRMLFSSVIICNTCSFLPPSVPLIFSILPEHHIWKLLNYFWSTFQSTPWGLYINYLFLAYQAIKERDI
jgi:hypothetical protein